METKGHPPSPAFAVLLVVDFALHALLRTRPQSRSRPVALLDDARRKAVITALTPAARQAGVEVGFTTPLALARCPGLTIVVPDPAAEAEARAALLAVGFSLSPAIEDTGPGICTVDLAGHARERHEPAVRDAVLRLEALGLPATAGLAPTPLLALYAARETDTVRRVDAPRAFLDGLPLAAAEPPPALIPVLAGWGVRTLGDLTVLPKAEVVRRLGPEGLALWERAAGQICRPLRRTTPAQTFAAAMVFEHEIETLEPLTFVLRRFIDRLAVDLANAGFCAAELTLGLSLSDETRYTRNLRLPEPTGEAEILFRTLHTHLETLHTTSSVVGVTLEVTPTRPLVRQQGLFETGLRDPHGFAETLARTVAVVGPDRSGTPQIDDSHRPDAVTLVAPAPVVPSPPAASVIPIMGPPLRRFRPPLAATVELTGEQPSFLWTPNIRGAITATNGPWHGSGDWWRPDLAWEREEWDISVENGGLYRLINVPSGWFLEGEYD